MTFVLIVIVGVVAIAGFNRVNALRADFAHLRDQLSRLQTGLRDLEQRLHSKTSEASPSELTQDVEDAAEPAPVPKTRPAATFASTGIPSSEAAKDDAVALEEPVPGDVQDDIKDDIKEPEEQEIGETGRPVGAEFEAVAAAGDAGTEFEAKLGSYWTLRVGLGLLAIAAAYYARAIFPTLAPGWKVAMAYAGAAALFTVGKVFERKLARFAKPVMAGGLALGFFVSYAAYFVTPMRAVSLPLSLAWMTAGVVAILAFAERWRSQPLAALAIVLGHTSAYVAAGSADSFSLVIITALSIVAVVLLVRHDWVELTLFAIVAAYAAHIMWSLAEHPPVAADRAFWLNVAFFASYYIVFLVGDLVWWRRAEARSGRESRRFELLTGRLLGPVNVTLFLSVVCYLYVRTDVYLTDIHWFFFLLAIVQAAHGRYLKALGNDDYVFYPAVGTILVTLGVFSAFQALSLNLILAVEALLLLFLAHRTRVWLFHPLAQAVLAANFLHSWAYADRAIATAPAVVGTVAVVAVYMVLAWLEEQWYGRGGETDWDVPRVNVRLPFDSASRYLAERFDEIYSSVAPYLCFIHAACGAVILTHYAVRLLTVSQALMLVSAILIVLLAVALVFRSAPLLVGYLVLQWGIVFTAYYETIGSSWVSWSAVTAGFLAALVLSGTARSRFEKTVDRKIALVVCHGALWGAIVTVPVALLQSSFSDLLNLPWIVPLTMLFVQQDRVSVVAKSLDAEDDEKLPKDERVAGAVACFAGGVLVVLWTAEVGESAGLRTDFAAPVLLALWSGILFVVAGMRNRARIYVGSATVLALCYVLIPPLYNELSDSVWATLWVVGVTLGIAGAQDARIAAEPTEDSNRALTVTTYAAYVLGLSLLFVLFDSRFGFPWSVVAMAAMPFALVVFSRMSSARCAAWVAFLSFFFLQLRMGIRVYEDGSLPGAAVLWPALALSVLAVTYERIIATRIPLLSANNDAKPHLFARLILIAGVAAVAMVAVYRSEALVGGWVTASWSIVGAALMTLGFAWKSASYRRVALVVLALCLVRVFVVDIRNLSDQAKVLAFATLGVCLIAVAWLYSRFAKDVKRWL